MGRWTYLAGHIVKDYTIKSSLFSVMHYYQNSEISNMIFNLLVMVMFMEPETFQMIFTIQIKLIRS